MNHSIFVCDALFLLMDWEIACGKRMTIPGCLSGLPSRFMLNMYAMWDEVPTGPEEFCVQFQLLFRKLVSV